MDTPLSDSRRAAFSDLWGHDSVTIRNQVRRSDQPTLCILRHLRDLRVAVDRAIDHLVRAAREEDASWGQIAEELGMSRQAAHERWRHDTKGQS